MTEAADLVRALRMAGAELWVEAGRPRVRAPTGVLTPERRATLALHRDAVLVLLIAEADVWALDRLDAMLGDDGAEPSDPSANPTRCGGWEHNEEPPSALDATPAGLDVDATVRNALALSDQEREAWRQEIVDALVWVEAGHGVDAHLKHDLQALRQVMPGGTCPRDNISCPSDGRHCCINCSVNEAKAMGVKG